jgi:4-oxalocrotonate tautomerase
MPLVNVRLIEGVFTPEQKSEMIRQLTETMVKIEGENLRPVTWVVVEEVKSGDWGIGGKGLTAADVHARGPRPPASACLTCQAAPYRTGTPFGHNPGHAKGPLGQNRQRRVPGDPLLLPRGLGGQQFRSKYPEPA